MTVIRLALLFIVLTTCFSLFGNAPEPPFEMDNPENYKGLDVWVEGFDKFRDTQFYMVNLRQGIQCSKISNNFASLNYNGKQACFISWAPFLKDWQEGQVYGKDTDEYDRFRDTLPIMYGFWVAGKEHTSFRIRFNSYYGYKDKTTGKKTLVFTIKKTDVNFPEAPKFMILPDAKTYKNAKNRYPLGEEPNDRKPSFFRFLQIEVNGIYLWVTGHPNNHKSGAQSYIRKLLLDNPHGLYRGLNSHILEKYERDNKIFFMLFFCLAAIVTIIVELVVLLMLFPLVTGMKVKEKAGTLEASCILGTSFTLIMLWWICPSLLHTLPLVTISGEIFAFVIEALIYRFFLRITYRQAYILSFACNAASYLIGLAIIPNIKFLF